MFASLTSVARFACACALAAAALQPPAFARPQAQDKLALRAAFETARTEYLKGHFAAAYGRFVQLADQGCPDAAHLAWHMHRWGPVLYGTSWSATTPQLRAWSALVADEAADDARDDEAP